MGTTLYADQNFSSAIIISTSLVSTDITRPAKNIKSRKWVNIDSEKGLIGRAFYGDAEPIVSKEEAEANAKLIAAAPDLLQNCIWCINNFNNVLPVATKEESLMIYEALIENLEKAINKATK